MLSYRSTWEFISTLEKCRLLEVFVKVMENIQSTSGRMYILKSEQREAIQEHLLKGTRT